MNSEILELTAKIDAFMTTMLDFAFIGVMCMVVGVISLGVFSSTIYDIINKYRWTLLIIPAIFLIIGVFLVIDTTEKQNTITELKEQRNKIFQSEIDTMTCTDLRILLLEIMQEKHDDYIQQKQEWLDDYYYLVCETPLRDEVLKLQETQP